jgi:hypothetical protein
MILTGPSNRKISAWRKLSAVAGILVVAVSTLGVLATALDSHAMSQQEPSPRPAFAVASVKSDKSQGNMDMGGNEKFHALRISLEGSLNTPTVLTTMRLLDRLG